MRTQAKIRPLYQRAPRLSQKELREINGLFPAYLFRRRRTREIWTTCCGVHQTLPEGSPILEAVHQAEEPPSAGYGCHCGWMSAPPPRPKAQPEACPFCGRVSPVKELGRTGRRKNLWSYVRVVIFRQYHGALWAVAYEARKDYIDPARLTALPEAHMVAAYRFLPGRVEFCRRNWWEKTWDYMDAGTIDTKGLKPKFKLPNPFRFCFEWGTAYAILGIDQVEQSEFRYCGFREYQKKGTDPVRFLALCTAYPRQVEMLMKAGLKEAVVDFVTRGKRNAVAFDWYDPDPFRGFGLNKAELSDFLSGARDLDVLAAYKKLRRTGVKTSFRELYGLRDALTSIWFVRTVDQMRAAKLSVPRLLHYLRKIQKAEQGRRKRPKDLPVFAGWWCDYITAAKVLGYDLSNDVFRLPKDLNRKHDEATKAAAKIKDARKNAELRKKEAKRLQTLALRYTYTDGRWLIRPPLGAEEIVAEGKVLRNCLGGYAERHVRGSTTILFLRDRTRPGHSLVAIEMNGNQIVQAHGWDDERTSCKDNPKRLSPQVLYREFLDGWLAWLEAGSRRDKRGYPILPKQTSTEVA